MLPQLDPTWYASQSLWMLITFSLLFVVVWKFILPAMNVAIEGRQHRLDDDMKKAEEFKTEAESVLKEYQNAMASANERARFKLSEAQKEMAGLLKQREEEFSARLQERTSAGEQKLAAAKKEALDGVKDISTGLVADIARKLAGISPKAEAVEQEVTAQMEKWQ